MDVGIVVALIAAGTSLGVATVTQATTRARDRQTQESNRELAELQKKTQFELTELTHSLQTEARREERSLTVRAELDRFREPLLSAALELAQRIDNIRRGAFLDAYLDSPDSHRREIARTSTFYRVARYWYFVELLHDKVALPRFQSDDATRPVAGTLRCIGRAFASDRYGYAFMMWREEQRAIAESLREADDSLSCIGFATFAERYDSSFAPWFQSFDLALRAEAARESDRLEVLQHYLAVLVSQLDLDGAYEDQSTYLRKNARSEHVIAGP